MLQEKDIPKLFREYAMPLQIILLKSGKDNTMTRQQYWCIGIFIVVLLILPTERVYADAGTGFFFPGIFHVFIGNIVIGLIEAFFVRKVFKVSASYGIIILGNYVSSFVGHIAAIVGFWNADLLSISVLPGVLALLFIASVLIEWPFFGWAVEEQTFAFSITSFKHSLSKASFRYSLCAQCVSYAFLVPYYYGTFDQGLPSPRDTVENQINNLAASVYQYTIRYGIVGGGGGSYKGYTIPAGSSLDAVGHYSATVAKDSIIFVAADTGGRRTVASVVLDSAGGLHSWKYAFVTGDSASRDHVLRHAQYLAQLAHDYRMRPFLLPGRRSYLAYSIPEKLLRNEFASFATVLISRDSIVFMAISLRDTTVTMTAVLDSAGTLHGWKESGEFR